MRHCVFFFWILIAPLGVGAAESPYFTDITASAGIAFTHDPGGDGHFLMPEIMGSGAALLDFDADGDLDIYLIQSAGANRLYRQESNGVFVDVTAASGLGDEGYGMGVAAGDFDNDGLIDLYVTNYGRDGLYKNEGSGRFSNVTASAGIDGEGWSVSATFCDYDADGFLDLYVTQYVRYDAGKSCYREDGGREYCSPGDFDAAADLLYHNNGNGTFTDVSSPAGITASAFAGLGVVCADLNGDGRLDFFVANDKDPNSLWENRGDGRFEDSAILEGVAYNTRGQAEAGMGIALGDVGNDEDLDLFLTHFGAETNTLYLRDGELGFEDRTARARLAAVSLRFTGFGTGFFDFDHDGALDLAVVNGRVIAEPSNLSYAEPNGLYRGAGGGRFVDVSENAGSFASEIGVSRGLAFGDVDGDGDVDLLVTENGGEARLFKNDAAKKGRWLTVRAFDPALGRDAYGARITIATDNGRYVRVATPGYSYASSNDPRAHFGLSASARVRSLSVRWPDGKREIFPRTELDRVIELRKSEGKPLEQETP